MEIILQEQWQDLLKKSNFDMRLTLLILILLFPNYTIAKGVLGAQKSCLGLIFTPKIILETLYDKILYKKLLKRVDREIEDEVITKELAEMIKHIIKSKQLRNIAIEEGRVWCNERK